MVTCFRGSDTQHLLEGNSVPYVFIITIVYNIQMLMMIMKKKKKKMMMMMIIIIIIITITRRVAVYLETHYNIGSKRAFPTGVLDR